MRQRVAGLIERDGYLLVVTSTSFVCRIDHAGGSTAVFNTLVRAGDPVLGIDPEIECDCPRMVGPEWVPAREAWCGADALSILKVDVPDIRPTS